MKLIRLICMSAVFTLVIPAASYGYADLGIYGGYMVTGKSEAGTASDSSGMQAGVIGHLAMNLPMLARFGIGGYYEHSVLSFKTGDDITELIQRTLAADLYAQLMLPSLPLYPYARVSITGWENRKTDNEDTTNYFQNYSLGGGIAYPVQLEIFELNIFAEYMYGVSELIFGEFETSHALHFGMRIYI